MKKVLLLITIFFFLVTLNTEALTYTEIESRSVCPSLELAIANTDKSLTKIECYDTYSLAYEAMNNHESDDVVILERKNNKTRIINSKYALVFLGVKSSSETTYYYENSNLTNYITYMNHHINYGASDGVFLEYDSTNNTGKVKTNGVVGWISLNDFRIIPLNFLGNFSYYKVTSTELEHFYAKDIQATYSQFKRAIDKKPSNLNVGSYYSYDGHYFYNDLKKMINDYKNNNYDNSINKNNPYYNYYMYLPHRSLTNYTNDDIDSYLKNNKGLIGTIYGNKKVTGYSNMFQSGIYFKSSEYLYGSNAILMMSLAINESALGQSDIAIFKNNLFGHAAYDSSAYDSATGYLNTYQSIIGHAKDYINCKFVNPSDYRYNGANLGDKTSGMNILYASDPYWGEKAANYYYSFDKDNGFLDYNYYQLGLVKYSSINVRIEPNTTSGIPYAIKKNSPVIILGEVEGTLYEGSTKWYKIVSDANLSSDRTNVLPCSYTNYYNYNSYVYVHSSLIDKINTTYNNKYNDFSSITSYKNYTYHEYSNKSVYKPIVGLVNEDSKAYDTATLTFYSNQIIKKGEMVTIFMEARDKDNKVVAYLVTADYSKNQRRWIDASNVSIIDKDILKVNLINSGTFLNVFKEPNNGVLGSIYTNTYSVIVDKETINNDLWLKIHYNNTYAWINTNVSTDYGNLEYTIDKINQVPVITASDQTLMLFDDFDPKDYVKAMDYEDGDITSKVKVNGTVDTNKAGTYQITYEVSDSKNLKTTKTIKVVVKNYTLKNSLFMFHELKYLKDDTFSFKGFLGIKGQDNIDIIHYLVFKNQLDNKEYKIKLDKFKDYPFEMKSLDDTKNYNYSGGWFMGNISLDKSFLKQGDYTIYVEAYSKKDETYTREYFTNIAYLDMARRVDTTNRGYSFDVDYSYSGSPIILSIRDNGLLSNDIPKTMDPMYNFFNELSLTNNTLKITGTSHSASVSYSKKDTVKREIIFENIKTFKRYSYDLSYIDNGPYEVVLPVTDNKDKTRAWFKKEINLSNLEKGTYAIYIKTTSNNLTYYGELIDIAYTDFKSINTDKYNFKRIDNKRLRLELEVK